MRRQILAAAPLALFSAKQKAARARALETTAASEAPASQDRNSAARAENEATLESRE